MSDDPPTPPASPWPADPQAPPRDPWTKGSPCRRCGRRVIRTATTFGRVVMLDAAPDPAGMHRLRDDSRAEALGVNETIRGETLYAEHLCTLPALAHDTAEG